MIKRNARLALCASTALTVSAAFAHAQTAPNTQTLNLGIVTATGQGGYVAPSAVGGLAQARQQKRLAPNIISEQPQSQIRKLPDVNVAESLERVPGVSLETDSGAGRFINIRGLDADLNATTYDGLLLPAASQATPSGGSRAVGLDIFPSGLVGGTEVIKSLTPEMNAEGLGGEVNMLSPALPANGKPYFDLTAGGGVESLRTTPVFNGNITYGQHFAIPGLDHFANSKPFSFIGTYSYHSDERGINDLEQDYAAPTVGGAPAPVQDLQYRWYQEHRIVRGYSGELDFDPSPQTNIFFRGLHTGYEEFNNKNRLQIFGLDGSNGTLTDNGGGSYTSTGATAIHQFTNTNERVNENLLELGGRTVIGDLVSVDAHTSYAQGSDIFTRGYSSVYSYSGAPFTVTYNTSNPAQRPYSAPGVDLANPSNFTYTGISNTPSRAFDQIFENAGNASVPTSFLNTQGEFKVGTDIRLRERSVRNQQFSGTPNDPNISLASLTGGNSDNIYYNGLYNVGPNRSIGSELAIPTTYTENTAPELAGFQHDSENVYAGYVQQTINIGNLTALGGVRIEATEGAYGANAATTNSNGNTTYAPNVNHQSYTNVLPSVQLTYRFSPEFQVRAAYSTGIARPGFQQITGAKITDYQASTVSEGNPSLKPTTGNNLDLTAEFYPTHAGLFSVDFFYKSFDNYIAQTSQNITIVNPSGGQVQPALLTSYENIGGATATGVELEASQKLYFLPAPLDGLGVDANLTYVNATAQVHQGMKKTILPQTSPLTYNAAAYYEKGPINLRVAMNYVSRNVFAVGRDPSTDIFSQPRFRLDIGGTYSITPQLQIYADVKNITNTKLEFTQSASSVYPIQREFYGQDYFFGIHYKIN
ncbi:MAG: TonB-dependent receptor [Acidocella sp.]|nr:TonB-dependent receptor [Acidocella sp.]MDR3718967.1 TonB-dependent receptor [Bryobacteraceae bacterium]